MGPAAVSTNRELEDGATSDAEGGGEPFAVHPHSRLILYFVREFFLRSAETVSTAFDHDYEAAILFLTISNRNAQKVMDDPVLRGEYASCGKPIPQENTLFVS